MEPDARPDPPPDGPSWEGFLAAHVERIGRAVRRVCRDEDEAADVATDVLARFRADWPALLARFRRGGRARFEVWLAVVARNAAVDALRRRHGRDAQAPVVRQLGPGEEPGAPAPPDERARGERARASLREILRELSGDERLLLRLYFLEGRDAVSLQRVFGGRSRSLVYNRVHTLIAKLKLAALAQGLDADDLEHLKALDWHRLLGEQGPPR